MQVKIPLESSKDSRDQIEPPRPPVGTQADLTAQATQVKHEKISIQTQINHAGEVNKARYMPQCMNIIATKTTSGEVHIFDYFKHPSKPSNDEVKPDLKLLGHKKEGFGLAWNPVRPGYLLSGSDDNLICVWDVNHPNQLSNTLEATSIYDAHT
jgi:histone-binding protein RBBP4